MNFPKWINRILPFLTIISLTMAILSWRDSQEITLSLSTRYIGLFPDFLPLLEEVVNRSTERLLIAAGLPGFGAYSEYDKYRKYQTAIEGKVGRLRELRVLVLDASGRKDLTEGQFRGQNFDFDVAPTKEFKHFRDRWGYQSVQIASMDSFQKALLEVHTRIIKTDFLDKKIPCIETGGPMPVFVWIADDKVAVFAIPNLQAAKPEEGAFLTYDARLIKQLTSIFHTYERGMPKKP